ncbi:MAG TPA: 2'-deoxycytidine 5'-triphosphate deaminase, partial [Nitrospiria bacterium]
LRLGPVAYRVRASFLPGKDATVMEGISGLVMHEIDLSSPAVMEKGCVYIVPLMEELNLPDEIFGKANPKSTTGRLDVFTRLITDYGEEFERVPAGYKGKLYAEVVPRTFSILVREGTKLNQLRLIDGLPPAGSVSNDEKLGELDQKETLVYSPDDRPKAAKIAEGLWISVDLEGIDGDDLIGFRAKHHAPLIDLSKVNYYNPLEFWEPIRSPKSKSLILNPDDFYILISKEKVRIPADYAAEMVAYDPSVGEFRIHYAGFFDPGFGYGNNNIKGTRAVLEVRSHEVPFLLGDGQVVGRLIYETLRDTPKKIYGTTIGSSYQGQGLSLSKQFKPL